MNFDLNVEKLNEEDKELYNKLCEKESFKIAGPVMHKIICKMYSDFQQTVDSLEGLSNMEVFFDHIENLEQAGTLAEYVENNLNEYLNSSGNTLDIGELYEGLDQRSKDALSILNAISNKIINREVNIDEAYTALTTKVKWDISEDYKVLTAEEYGIIGILVSGHFENEKAVPRIR